MRMPADSQNRLGLEAKKVGSPDSVFYPNRTLGVHWQSTEGSAPTCASCASYAPQSCATCPCSVEPGSMYQANRSILSQRSSTVVFPLFCLSLDYVLIFPSQDRCSSRWPFVVRPQADGIDQLHASRTVWVLTIFSARSRWSPGLQKPASCDTIRLCVTRNCTVGDSNTDHRNVYIWAGLLVFQLYHVSLRWFWFCHFVCFRCAYTTLLTRNWTTLV